MISDAQIATDLRGLLREGRARITAREPIQINGRVVTQLTVVVSEQRLEACTGVAAEWCPVCGTCTCAGEAEDRGRVGAAGCPLHGPHSRHAGGP